MEEEQAERETIAAKFIDAIRPQLPALMQSLAKIKDYRNPKKIEHQLTMVLLYGILCFVLQTSSRREANRELSGPVLLEHLRTLFPEMDKIPHQDTLNRILSGIDVEDIQQAHLEMIRRLIRNKKFDRWLVAGCYPIAIDGTQKAVRREQLSPQWLQRRINAGTDNEHTQYYVYVLEANLAFANGLTLPLMSEFLNYAEGDTSNDKQDCETKSLPPPGAPAQGSVSSPAHHAPARRPVPQWPRTAGLSRESLAVHDRPARRFVAERVGGVRRAAKLEPDQQARRSWGNRLQHFRWVNDIEYRYGTNQRNKQIVHVVVCEESWEEIDAEGNVATKTSRHAWLSSERLTKRNLHERCNLGARHRWGIEEAILVEKRHGYQYEHLFSLNWNAMKGYHYLMHLGHALNVLAQYSAQLYEIVVSKGVRPFIKYVRDSLLHPWLDAQRLRDRLSLNPQLRLV